MIIEYRRKSNSHNIVDILTQFYIFFCITLFVPATSSDYYFNYYFGFENIVNKLFFNTLLLIMIILSFRILLTKTGESRNTITIFLSGIFLILWNQFLISLDSTANYKYFGFLLLTYPIISNLRLSKLHNSIIYSVFFLLLAILLSYFSNISNIILFPILESRYSNLSANSGIFRYVNSSLYGQSNAAGAAFTYCFFFLLILLSQKQNRRLLYLAFLLFLGIVATSSVGSILVSLAALSFFIIKRSTKYRPILIIIVVGLYIFTISYFTIFAANFDSGLVKWNRVTEFFNYASTDLRILLVGDNITKSEGSQHFYTESSMLDFWLNFGLLGFLMLLNIFIKGIIKAFMNKKEEYSIIFILLFIMAFSQNSSLMPANIIVILSLYSKLNREVYHRATILNIN